MTTIQIKDKDVYSYNSFMKIIKDIKIEKPKILRKAS